MFGVFFAVSYFFAISKDPVELTFGNEKYT
jgi:hypothetical protein